MNILLDTSILVSALTSGRGPSRRLLEMARARQFRLIGSTYILQELHDVLIGKFRYEAAAASEAQAAIERISVLVEPPSIPAICRDPADNAVLAAGLEGRATLLVTGDHDLLALHTHEGIGIVSAADGLQVIEHLLEAEARR